MKLVVGLGNPGPKYETTRHNVGFLAVDRLVDRWRAVGPQLRSEAEVYQAKFMDAPTWLIKPQTFMNLSGKSVAPIFKFYQLKPEDLLVIHDDLDLPLHTLRLKTGGGAGGHNGIKSIDECLGKGLQGYHRLRIGIGRPGSSEPESGDSEPSPNSKQAKVSVPDYVLGAYSKKELQELDRVLDDAADAVEMVLRGDILKAMNQFNRKNTQSKNKE